MHAPTRSTHSGLAYNLRCGTSSRGKIFLRLAFQFGCLWKRGPFAIGLDDMGDRATQIVCCLWHIRTLCGIWARARVGRHLHLLGGSSVISWRRLGFVVLWIDCWKRTVRVPAGKWFGPLFFDRCWLTLSDFVQNTKSIMPKKCVKTLQNVLDHGVQYLILSFRTQEWAREKKYVRVT